MLSHVLLPALLCAAPAPAPAAPQCTFCGTDAAGKAVTFDLSGLPSTTWSLDGVGKDDHPIVGEFSATAPCGAASKASCGPSADPVLQECRGLGSLVGTNASVVLASDGFNLTLRGGDDDPPMKNGRNTVYRFLCDPSASAGRGPEKVVVEHPAGYYNVVWRTKAACTPSAAAAKCAPPPPAPPPILPPANCMPGAATCLPTWKPTWDMKNSTVLYTCNNTGMHNVTHANQFGIVVYDWSNAKAIWANAHPMSSEELITKQAEMVYAQDPGVPGYAPRVWAYRNTIKALNWYSSVREKLDDPKYASWFIKFKGFDNTPYPGGAVAKGSNDSYHVPTCDWYNNGTAPRCSGFYHDQEQTPEHPGAGGAYHVDGACVEQCDCGPTNPCGEYIFDHRGGEVDGRTFRDWWINEYMVTNETLYHKDPRTGDPQPIGLGWLDDKMKVSGPTEEDTHYIADTCGDSASPACVDDVAAQVAAYDASVLALKAKVVPMGGFWWQLLGGSPGLTWTPQHRGHRPPPPKPTPAQCTAVLRNWCTPNPEGWAKYAMYKVANGGKNISAALFTDYTAEFLLTRGPYALLGYSWCGCTNGEEMRPRAAEWDEDFGQPQDGGAACKETSVGSGVFEREWTGASVQWDCATGHGKITRK